MKKHMSDYFCKLWWQKHILTGQRDLLNCVDRAIVLSNGKIIASGSPSEIIKDTSARTAYFGDEFKIN